MGVSVSIGWAVGSGALSHVFSPASSAAPSLQLLAGYNNTPFSEGWSETLNFTVPAGLSAELFVWALGGSNASFALPTLPAGMTVKTSTTAMIPLGGFESGIAAAALAPGAHSVALAYGGTTADVSMAVYGISSSGSLTLRYASINMTTSLALSAGAVVYVGTLADGGGYPVLDPSLAVINERAATDYAPGWAQLIGTQTNDTFSFISAAHTPGISAVGVYDPPP